MIRTVLMTTMALALVSSPASADGVEAGLARLKAEPTVRDVQEAALRYFRVNLSLIHI